MKKQLLLVLMTLLPLVASAYDAEIDGIYYNFSENEAKVTYYNNNGYIDFKYSGNVAIPESVTYNGITYNVTSIGESAFNGCNGLTSVTIPNSVTIIGPYAFYGCSSLTSVTIPNSVTHIGIRVFNRCNLTSIKVGEGNTTYDSRNNCNAIIETATNTLITGCKNTIIPDDLTRIGSYAFMGCNGLSSITIPNSVYFIGESAFNDCGNLPSVTIPENIIIIEDNAFSYCNNLFSVTLESNAIASITWTPSTYGSLIELFGPQVKEYIIGSEVKKIGDGAFRNCTSLTSFTIGNSVTSIGDEALANCYRLTTINCLNPVPPTCAGAQTFACNNDYVRDKYDVYNYATLHVPMGSKEAYSSAYEWRYFNKIKEDMEMDGKVYYANLVVQQGAEGYTRQQVKTEEKYTFYIGSYGYNTVNTVLFNGKDVTNEVINGYYTTPEIKGESILSISYEIEDGINPTMPNDVKVSGYNGEIQIRNIDEPSDVFVYSTDGKLVGNANAALGSTSLPVQGEQLYIVKVGSRTYKVTMP